jgi:DNA-binding transcriptional ArsR family regulator
MPRQWRESTKQVDECDPGRRDVLVISDLDVLRLISDPVRIQLLELMRGSPRTVKELASELGVPSTRLYYHMNLLEEHGLIRIKSTRMVSGIVEKRYEVSAARLSVDRSLLTPLGEPSTGLETQLAFILDEAKAEIRKAYNAGLIDASHEDIAKGGLELGRIWFHLTIEEAAELDRRLTEILDDYRNRPPDDENPNKRPFEFLLGFYPIESGTHNTDSAKEE